MNLTGARELVNGMRRKERLVSNKTWVGDAVPWETIVMDNSGLNYSAGASWGVTPRKSVVIGSGLAKCWEVIVITGANTAKLAFYEYLNVRRTVETMQGKKDSCSLLPIIFTGQNINLHFRNFQKELPGAFFWEAEKKSY